MSRGILTEPWQFLGVVSDEKCAPYYGVASRRGNHRAGTASEVLAQPFPSRRITLMVPFPAGTASEGVTRRLAESIHDQAGVTVLVENKPGADGNLAALSVLKADADGYRCL